MVESDNATEPYLVVEAAVEPALRQELGAARAQRAAAFVVQLKGGDRRALRRRRVARKPPPLRDDVAAGAADGEGDPDDRVRLGRDLGHAEWDAPFGAAGDLGIDLGQRRSSQQSLPLQATPRQR